MKKTSSVEEYIENSNFSAELKILRDIILSTEVEETLKWNAPVYTVNGKNVLGLGAFKNHYGIWFFNGVFLKDKSNLLVNAQENKTKALRQMRFENNTEINTSAVLDYVKEAIENQKLGKVYTPQRTSSKSVNIPQELQNALDKDSNLKLQFNALTPSKQKEYCQHISEAKREITKQKRLDKIKPMILKGSGLHDKYKNC